MARQPFVPVSRVVRFRVLGQVQQAPYVNSWAFQYAGPAPDMGALDAFCIAAGGFWATNIAPVAGVDSGINGVEAWDISSSTAASGTDNATHLGTYPAANPVPVSVCEVISWPVQDRWRGGHFRTYFPAVNYADYTSGRYITQARMDSLKSAWNNFRTAINSYTIGGANIVMGGVVYFPRGLDANGNMQVKTSGQFRGFGPPLVHGRLDTQRRRLGKEIT